jgi:hypothetical protein
MLTVLTTVVLAGLRASLRSYDANRGCDSHHCGNLAGKSSLEKLLPLKLSYISAVLLFLIACVIFIAAMYFLAAHRAPLRKIRRNSIRFTRSATK